MRTPKIDCNKCKFAIGCFDGCVGFVDADMVIKIEQLEAEVAARDKALYSLAEEIVEFRYAISGRHHEEILRKVEAAVKEAQEVKG